MKIKPAYVCDYCESHTLHLPSAKRHAKVCLMNPVHRACKSCRWWFKNRPTYGTRFREFNKIQFLPFCSHPEMDYSEEMERDEYVCDRFSVPRKDCDGWAAIKTADMNKRQRLKRENIEEYERREAAFRDSIAWRY